ncbi:MAG: hypothetical protein P4M08_05560 [Oligoflexia bacterium]|nr:hypothetical protein [Oligoflexia bacterium]
MKQRERPSHSKSKKASPRSSDLRIASVEYATGVPALSSAQLAALWRMLSTPASASPPSPSEVADESSQPGGVDDDSA